MYNAAIINIIKNNLNKYIYLQGDTLLIFGRSFILAT